jgi:DNA-directed RNA polymerase subunit RPC12/RpoP
MTTIRFGYCIICKCGQYFEQVATGWRCPRCHETVFDPPKSVPQPCAACQVKKEQQNETQE